MGYGQVGGGFGNVQPVALLDDPLFYPSTDPINAPYGQHWAHTTRLTYAWGLSGYGLGYSIDPNDKNRAIAIIDSGIDVEHPEFNVSASLTLSKIHPDSRTFVTSKDLLGPICRCDQEYFYDDTIDTSEDWVHDRWWRGTVDFLPHGTIVAGLAGAYANNDEGIAGACWDCSLLVIRMATFRPGAPCDVRQWTMPDCSLCLGDTAERVMGIRYAAGWNPTAPTFPTGINDADDVEESWYEANWSPVRARVISISTNVGDVFSSAAFVPGTPSYDIVQAVRQAINRGCVVVVMAGNTNIVLGGWVDPGTNLPAACVPFSTFTEYEDLETPIPGTEPQQFYQLWTIGDLISMMPETITVGGVCRDAVGWHSISRINPLMEDLEVCGVPGEPGCVTPWYSEETGERAPVLSIAVPIGDLFSTFSRDNELPNGAPCLNMPQYGDLTSLVGTSWAPPQVAGVVALMLKANPNLTPAEVKHILECTATDIGPAGYDAGTGFGLLNAQAAVQMATICALPANFNGDESIDPLDAIDYLLALGTGDVMADLDLDTAHTSDDLTIFLNSYTAEE